jgi:GT2 family glycosyltransferase
VTALVCTRDRGTLVADAVGSILASDYAELELVVVDQSSDDQTESALSRHKHDPRLHYMRSATKGLARARNLGFSRVRPGIVAMTDDDCTVPPDWVHNMAAAFASSSRIAVVLGNVKAAPHDHQRGFISSYMRSEPFIARGVRDKARVEGIGACMGVRTDVWSELNGFDEQLGAGAAFRSADDTDFVMRALLAGHEVCETPDVSVMHHGFRTWADGHDLIRGYLFGIGAMMAKHLRCGHWSVRHVLGALAYRWAFEAPVVRFGFKPARSLRLAGFSRGFLAGSLTPIDRRTSQFAVMRNRRTLPL